MRLLIITQKVDRNDPILGFFHRWIVEFAKHCEAVVVICLQKGEHELPTNVRVLSLGKENGASRISYICRFYSYIWSERKNYDKVFVHMNPVYVVLGGFVWKVLGKKIFLWYTHKNVDLKLRIAEKFVDRVFTASKESFRLKSEKVMVTGHGVDMEKFSNVQRFKKLDEEPISIISVGRITPIKDPITLIKAAAILKNSWNKKFTIKFIGSPSVQSDSGYYQKVLNLVEESHLKDIVQFVGDIKPDDMSIQYGQADISVNLTPTGGVDKVVLESMAAGIPVLTSNEAFRDYFGEYSDRHIFDYNDPEDLAGKVRDLCLENIVDISTNLQRVARERAGVGVLILKIIDLILESK